VSVLVAMAFDAAWEEPPLQVHPVAWAGWYLDRVGRLLPTGPPTRAVVSGAVAWGLGMATAVAAGRTVERVAVSLPRPWDGLLRGAALWPLLSCRLLLGEVAGVEQALRRGVEPGRAALARIVSRDTTALPETEVRAGALESLAENLSDSVVAPLLWYAVGGLPAAAAYRFANTADACWGYRTTRWEYPGKVTARADDVLNVLPARSTAALLLLAGPSAWRRLGSAAVARERRGTPRHPTPAGRWRPSHSASTCGWASAAVT